MGQLTRFERIQIGAKSRVDWYEAMAKAIGDGKSAFVVVDKLAIEYTRTRHPMAPLLRELVRRMQGNKTSDRGNASGTIGSDLLGLVPENEANLIDAGESSGKLEDGFARAAEYLKNTTRLRDEVLGPLKEPAFLLLMLAGVLIFFSYEILPTFNNIAPRHTWPRGAQTYGKLADQAIPIAVAIVSMMVFGTMAFLKAAANWTGQRRAFVDQHIFPFTLVARVNSAAMLTSLAGYVAAGVKFDVALRQLHATSNPFMRTMYQQMRTSLAAGVKAEDALCNLHIMDKGYHWMIRLYGDSTDFAGAMRRISEEVIEFAIERTRKTFGLVNMLLKASVAGFVVWTMFSLFGVVQAVKATAQSIG